MTPVMPAVWFYMKRCFLGKAWQVQPWRLMPIAEGEKFQKLSSDFHTPAVAHNCLYPYIYHIYKHKCPRSFTHHTYERSLSLCK